MNNQGLVVVDIGGTFDQPQLIDKRKTIFPGGEIKSKHGARVVAKLIPADPEKSRTLHSRVVYRFYLWLRG